MAASASLGEEVDALRAKLARDVNCLADPNRAKRRGAVNTLKRVLDPKARRPLAPAVAAPLFCHVLRAPLLRCLDDEVEGVREGAIGIIDRACRQLREGDAGDGAGDATSGGAGGATAAGAPLNPVSLAAVARDALPVICARFSPLPFNEPAEELRLQLVRLMGIFIDSAAAAVAGSGGESDATTRAEVLAVLPDVSDALTKAASDAFPDVKKEVAGVVSALCVAFRGELHKHLAGLVASQAANTGHQHSRVRSAALRTLQELMPCASEQLAKLMSEHVLPALTRLARDRTASVRRERLVVLRNLATRLSDPEPYRDSLVRGLLAGLSDDAPDIQAVALTQIEELGAAIGLTDGEAEAEAAAVEASATASAADDEDMGDGAFGAAPAPLPAPFTGRPSAPARYLVRRLLPRILPPTLVDLSDWTVPTRESAAGELRSIVAFAEDGITDHLASIVAGLCRGCADEERNVSARTADAARLVGRFVAADAQLGVLLPQVRGEVSGLAAGHHRAASLSVLASSVAGMARSLLAPHLPAVAEALTDPALCDSDPPELRRQLLSVLGHTIATAGSLAGEGGKEGTPGVARSLLVALLQAQAAGGDADVDSAAAQLIAKLAAAAGFAAPGSLLVAHADALLASVTRDVAAWEARSLNCRVFDVLVRTGGAALAPHVPAVLATFTAALDPSRGAELRVAILALMDTFIGDDVADGVAGAADPAAAAAEAASWGSLDDALREVTPALVRDVLVPNCVWRVGMVAATIRKVSLACIYTLFRRRLMSQEAAMLTLEAMLPVLKSCLGDDDFATRHASCLVAGSAFALLPGALNDEQVRELYPELVKRLDDSNDNVRIAVCDAYQAFARSAPVSAFRGAPFEYTVDCLIVHLDDPAREIQSAALEALKAFIFIKPSYVARQAAEARKRHRSPDLCDEIIALCEGGDSSGGAGRG